MKFVVSLPLAVALAIAIATDSSGTAERASVRRRLSYQKIAGYSPGSQVTDHCAIDLDQQAIEAQLALQTPASFAQARAIYNEGGHSKSYAQVSLSPPLASALLKGAFILGTNAAGNEVGGRAYDDYAKGTSALRVQYATSDLQASYVGCQVGALVEPNTDGCFVGLTGELTIAGTQYAYTYAPETDNKNGRTIAGFSSKAKDKMRVGCKGCPYPDFQHFYNYYGRDDYAHHWVESAFAGAKTDFVSGNADFSRLGLVGRTEAIKKGTAYLNIFMYVIRELEDAMDDCERGCINCNDSPVHAWDEGVCFYTGSIEGQDGAASGKLLHQLADKRCENFKTCDVDGTGLSGTAKVNYDLFSLFSMGNYQLLSGNCPAARATVSQIIKKMYVPMIQGALRYAYKVDMLQGGEKEQAEGAVFAAAVLPRIHATSPSAAETVYDNLRVGAVSTRFRDVKRAFESAYPDIGINCADVGGLWDKSAGSYYPGMEPCATTVGTMSVVHTESDATLAIVLGCTFGALFAVAAMMLLYMYTREKQGEPVFEPATTHEDEVKDVE